ncbi:unnamed protein product, partial [Didymodactylos carnosus]
MISKPPLVSVPSNEPPKKETNGAAMSFTWGEYLKQEGSQAAPKNYFVFTVEGYLALLRYEGYEDDSSHDFWCNLCNKDVHTVGWCGQQGIKLAPPRNIESRQTDWKTFLVNKLTGAKTLPDNFRRKIQDSLRCPFKKNMVLEVIDKYRVSRMRVGKISDVIGGRLRINYENTAGEHFWVHYSSELIHPVGWSIATGHEIEADDAYKNESSKIMQTNVYNHTYASPDLFRKTRAVSNSPDECFKAGMKLEAVDPLEMSRICPATIGKVLKNGYFMLSIDGSSAEDGSDWFCYHSTSALIFPINFCRLNNMPLSPPIGYRGEFDWEKYLKETNSVYAPNDLFRLMKDKTINQFKIGMKIEAVDLMAPHLVCVATIANVFDGLIRVHFDGWDDDYEQWIDCESTNIYPIGWCELVGYRLEPPKQAEQENEKKMSTDAELRQRVGVDYPPSVHKSNTQPISDVPFVLPTQYTSLNNTKLRPDIQTTEDEDIEGLPSHPSGALPSEDDTSTPNPYMKYLDDLLSTLGPRWRNYVIRGVFSAVMIGAFAKVISMGPLVVSLLVLIVQIKCFQEIINIGYIVYKSHNLPWFRTLSWYFLFTSNYYFYGESLIHYFGFMMNKNNFLQPFVSYHRMISFLLYTAGFVGFVLSLKKTYYLKQFTLFGYTHITLLILVTASHLMIQNICEGMIWLLFPVSLIIVNDIMAYMFGFFYGRTPLTKLSPKKTWE